MKASLSLYRAFVKVSNMDMKVWNKLTISTSKFHAFDGCKPCKRQRKKRKKGK